MKEGSHPQPCQPPQKKPLRIRSNRPTYLAVLMILAAVLAVSWAAAEYPNWPETQVMPATP